MSAQGLPCLFNGSMHTVQSEMCVLILEQANNGSSRTGFSFYLNCSKMNLLSSNVERVIVLESYASHLFDVVWLSYLFTTVPSPTVQNDATWSMVKRQGTHLPYLHKGGSFHAFSKSSFETWLDFSNLT